MSITNKVTTYFACALLILLNVQCKKTTTEPTPETVTKIVDESIITAQDIETITLTEYVLSDAATEHTKNWIKFQNLQSEIEQLKKGNLSFYTEDKDILKGFLTDLKNEIPEEVSMSSILVRLTVLETFMYKLDEAARLSSTPKEVLLTNIEDVLVSYNHFIYQLNKEVEKKSQQIIKP